VNTRHEIDQSLQGRLPASPWPSHFVLAETVNHAPIPETEKCNECFFASAPTFRGTTVWPPRNLSMARQVGRNGNVGRVELCSLVRRSQK